MLDNTSIMNRLFLSFFVLSFLPLSLQAQSSAEYLHRIHDHPQVFEAYWNPMRPMMAAIGATGHSGPAPILRKGEFRLAIEGGVVFSIASSDQFLLEESDAYQISSGPSQLPTILGGNSDTRLRSVGTYLADGETYTFREYTAPAGLDRSQLGYSAVNASAGVGTGLEFQGRLLIPIEGGSMPFAGFGLGVKAGMSELLPALAPIPVDISLQVFYNQVSGRWEIPYETHPDAPASSPINQLPPRAELTTHQALVQLILSKKVGRVTPFITAGLSRNESILEATGDYPLTGVLIDDQTGDQTFLNVNVRNPYYGLDSRFLGHADVGVSLDLGRIDIQLVAQFGQRTSVSSSVGLRL